MKKLIFLFLVLTSLPLTAQEPLSISILNQEEEETIFPVYKYLLADNVLLRTEPSKDAQVLTKLKIGTTLIILHMSDQVLVLNGISSQWYKVNANEQIGWIWGGLIAQHTLISSSDPTIRFVAGYEKASYDSASDTHKCLYQLRAIKDNKQVDKIVFQTVDQINYFGKVDKQSLTNVEDILALNTICSNYDCIMQTFYLFWNNDKFYNPVTLESTVDEDGEGFHNTQELWLPSSLKEQPQEITIYTQKVKWEETTAGESEFQMVKTKDFFLWNGTALLASGKDSESNTHVVENRNDYSNSKPLNLTFEFITEKTFIKHKSNYDDKIFFDSTKTEKPGSHFSLTTATGIQKFYCEENYEPCFYYQGYLKPLNLYFIISGHRDYEQSIALDSITGTQFSFDSPFDSGANSILISKEEDQLLTYAVSPFEDRDSYIAIYPIDPKTKKIYFSNVGEFMLYERAIDDLFWIDKNSFAIKTYSEETWDDEQGKHVKQGLKYQIATIIQP